MGRALEFLHPFNGHSLPTVGVVDSDHRRSSLLNGHEVVIRSSGERPGKLLVFRHSWTYGSFPLGLGLGPRDFIESLAFLRLSGAGRGDDVVEISGIPCPVAPFSSVSPFLSLA